jgi:hypothetical protein
MKRKSGRRCATSLSKAVAAGRAERTHPDRRTTGSPMGEMVRPGWHTTCIDACGLGKDVVAAIGNLSQLLDGLIQVAALDGVPHGGAVESALEQLVPGGHAPAYGKQNSITQTPNQR